MISKTQENRDLPGMESGRYACISLKSEYSAGYPVNLEKQSSYPRFQVNPPRKFSAISQQLFSVTGSLLAVRCQAR